MRRAFLEGATLAWLAAALAWLGGCGPPTVAAATPASADPAPRLVHGRHDGFWWSEMGAQSAAVASFGPTFELPSGRFRQWSLVVFLPGGAEPLSCVQGLVDLESVTPIVARGESFAIELEPCAGCIWGQVEGDTQLVARADGIY
jgi:hypothetical protein